mgnify:CR=1 FL=1
MERLPRIFAGAARRVAACCDATGQVVLAVEEVMQARPSDVRRQVGGVDGLVVVRRVGSVDEFGQQAVKLETAG